jgi:DNA-binding transcriptional LysR family regulator
MELRHLRYFVAVAEELHFRRAAKRLNIAQPAVSEQIRKLEAELGVSLFVRTQRNVALTEAGVAMLDDARRVLSQADVAQRAAREANGRSVGRLRLGNLPDAVPHTLPHLLRRFATVAPGVRVTFASGSARELIESVRDRRIDVAVACLPAPVSGLRVVALGHEGVVAAVPVGHVCANETVIRLSGLEHTPLVMLARGVNPAFYDAALSACRADGVAPEFVEVAEAAVEQVLLAVASGAGIALLPASVEQRVCTPGVRFLPLAPPTPSCEIALVAHTNPSDTTDTFLRLARLAVRPRALRAAAA